MSLWSLYGSWPLASDPLHVHYIIPSPFGRVHLVLYVQVASTLCRLAPCAYPVLFVACTHIHISLIDSPIIHWCPCSLWMPLSVRSSLRAAHCALASCSTRHCFSCRGWCPHPGVPWSALRLCTPVSRICHFWCCFLLAWTRIIWILASALSSLDLLQYCGGIMSLI